MNASSPSSLVLSIPSPVYLPQSPTADAPAMLVKTSEQRWLLASVIALHLLLAAWLVRSPMTEEASIEPTISVSLLDAPSTIQQEPARASPAKGAATPRSVKTPTAQTPPASPPAASRSPVSPPVSMPVSASGPPTSAASTAAASGESRPGTSPAPAETRAETFVQARFDADYLQNPAPAYPPLARRMHEEGKVVLRVSVTPQGLAESVEIRTSSGSERLDQAALKTVKQWKFVPARRGDTAVQSWVLVPVQFKLEQ